MTDRKTETSNKQVQTTIHCFPHILLSNNQSAKVFSDRGCQTAATTAPETTDLNFYALLEFIPYQVIAEGCVKEVDLPRKALLQWNLSNENQYDIRSVSSRTTDREDLDLNKQRSVLKKSVSLKNVSANRLPHHFTMQKTVISQGAQTTLTVTPHVLNADEVANVFAEISIQTSITCHPNDSISNILPELKANLSHLSGYTETPPIPMKQSLQNEPLEKLRNSDELLERIDEPLEELPDEPPNKLPEESPDETPEETSKPLEKTTEEPRKDPPEETGNLPEECPEEQLEEPPEEQTCSATTQVDTLSVTISTAQVKSQHVCGCRTKMLNQMASRLQVQASTLKLTPIAFPPNVPFAERMVEVLNTIIAVLQTEMANLMDIYVEEEKATCACTEETTKMSSEDIKDNPQPSKCANTEAETNTDNYLTAIANNPKSCHCGASAVLQNMSSTIAQGSKKEVKKTTATHQIINPSSMQPDFVREDVVEEIVRTVTLSTNNETVIEEKVTKKTVREKLPGLSIENLMIESAIEENKPCKCSSKSGIKVIKPAEEFPTETDTEDLTEGASQATEAPIDEDELPKITTETVASEEEAPEEASNETSEAVVAEVAAEEETAEKTTDEIVPQQDERAPADGSAEPVSETQRQSLIQPYGEIVGDSIQNRRLSFIPCECHPTETGAAVPILGFPGPSAQEVSASEYISDPCSDTENPEPTTEDVDNASSNADELPMVQAEKAVKFKVLLKKGITDVKSVSATSAIVVRATFSCPDTSKNGKQKVSEVNSLPDLREQVIRLRVIYKNGSTESKTQIEEVLTPGRTLTIAPNKSHSSRVNQKESNISATVSFKKSERLICAKGPPKEPKLPYKKITYNTPLAASTNACNCVLQGSSQRQPAYNKPFSNLPIEIEGVSSSSMACPVHPKQPPSCVPASTSRSTPSSQHTSLKAANVEIIISYNTDTKGNANIQSESFMYEHDATYGEPYMDELVEALGATTGVQTDLTLGDKLESESLTSLGETEATTIECGSRTEIPWKNISLPLPGSYTIKPIKGSVQQVGVMTDQECKVESTIVEEKQEEEEVEEVKEREGGKEEGEQEGDAEEKSPGKLKSDEVCSMRKEPLLFEYEVYKDNEPYMESLYRAFPDSDEGECGSQTEIPWKDIILPEKCRIRKMPKPQKCTCRSGQEKISGMFIPSNTHSKMFEEGEDESLVMVHLGFNEQPSTLIHINDGGAAAQHSVPIFYSVSDLGYKPKRAPKNFKLQVSLANESGSFQTGIEEPQNIPTRSSSTSTQPFSVSQAFNGPTSSTIITIKPSTERQFPSERIPVPGGAERIMRIVNPSMYVGGIPTATRSCTSTNVTPMANKISVKNISSMPQISNQKDAKVTVSLRRVGEPDKVVSEKMNLVPGENRMILKVPDTPISVNLKMTTSKANAQNPVSSPCPVPCTSLPCPSSTEEPKEVFSPAKCVCKDKVKLDTFRQDPVMAALEAYEAEMKPLRQALTQLQQKIRNLNLPEMKGCMCTTVLQNQQPLRDTCPITKTTTTTVRSRVQDSADPFTRGRSGMRATPHQTAPYTYTPPGTCPYFQHAGFRPPPPLAYGRLPPPRITPRFEPYVASASIYTPSNTSTFQQNSRYKSGESHKSRSSGHRRQNREHRSNRDYGRTYPREDLAMEARHYGMYPDCRGRRYSNEKMAYQDSFVQRSRNKMGRSPERYKTRCVVSVHSGGNVTSDYSGCDSQGASDGEDSYHLTCSKQSSKRDRRHENQSRIAAKDRFKTRQHDDSTPCRDFFETQLRDGQAVKTSPDEFLSCPSQSTRRRGQNAVPNAVSKAKIQITFPRTN